MREREKTQIEIYEILVKKPGRNNIEWCCGCPGDLQMVRKKQKAERKKK
jgi:hypothetical protein